MASLQSLLGSKNFVQAETNLEKGKVWAFNNGSMYSRYCNCFCWNSPGNGTVVVESWGAGGSGSRMCCCGHGLPGNAGAYVKKTYSTNDGGYVVGCMGKSCGNTDLCFRGCSEPSQTCWRSGGSENGCMCAQGGRGGTSFCSTSPSMYCCFRANGFCTTGQGPNCGIVCNQCSGAYIACGYGSGIDVACCGPISCKSFFGCYPACVCMFKTHVAYPAGMFSQCGGWVTFGTEGDNGYANWSGMGAFQLINALNALSKSPSSGIPEHSCWNGNRTCGCYEMNGCGHHVPHGMGGMGSVPCPGVRDHGWRGGQGATRIKYISS